MATSSESERDGLNAIGNDNIEYRSSEGGLISEGPIGQIRPTGILARGTADKTLRNSRGGAGSREATERLRGARSR